MFYEQKKISFSEVSILCMLFLFFFPKTYPMLGFSISLLSGVERTLHGRDMVVRDGG